MNETEFWPCEHISKDKGNAWTWTKGKNLLEDNKFFCSYCGAKRPEEPSDGLQIILQNFLHREGFEGTDISRVEKDLREWKEDLPYKHRAKWTWEKGMPEAGCQIIDDLIDPRQLKKEEKPKKLWLILTDELHKKFKLDKPFWQPKKSGESFWREAARIALDWFEKILPKSSESLGWNACLREIKQRLVEEKEEL